MSKSKGEIVVPVLILAIGVGWLLKSLGVIPGVDWAWSLGLGVAGLLWLVCSGINKFTVVVGPFLLAASVLSIARQTGYLEFKTEVPMLVIALGALSLVSRLLNLPTGLENDKR